MVAIEHSQQSTAIATATTEAEPHEHEPQLEDASPEQTDVAVIVERSCISSSETNTINTTTSNSSSFAASSSSDTTVPSVIGDMSTKNELESAELAKKHQAAAAAAIAKSSAVSQRGVDITLAQKTNVDATTHELSKKVLKLDLTGKELDEFSLKSPKSPINARLPHQTSLTSSVDVEDRKTLREALYQGIFHRHRRTIFAVGSFLRMLRSRNSQYNTIRSSSEGEDMEEVR